MLISPSYRRAVIGCILSHLIAWRSQRQRCTLLVSLSGITDSSLFRGVLPLLSPLDDDTSEESVWLAHLSDRDHTEYLDQVFATLTPQSGSMLGSDEEGEAWKMILAWISHSAQSRQ